jgi:hypothetical protein
VAERRYIVEWRIENKMQAVVVAESAQQAREKFRNGNFDESTVENTFHDRRVGGVKVFRDHDA